MGRTDIGISGFSATKELDMKKIIHILLIVVAVTAPQIALAASPLQTVETQVTQLVSVLAQQSPSTSSGTDEKKAAIRTISDQLFDFVELSRLTLGRNWRGFNTEQKKEFVQLYRHLLEGIYMDRLLQYKDEKVIFKTETKLSETRSEVQSDMISANGNIPIHYRLVLKDGKWKVYDLIIENVSLARNYRGQFGSILSQGTPGDLLATLRKKVNNFQ